MTSDARVAHLERELAHARSSIDGLARSQRLGRKLTTFAGIALVATLGWAAHAQTGIKAVAANNPMAQVDQKLAALEKRLQGRIDLLELRVRKLEAKPDNVDNEKPEKPGGSGSGTGGGTEAGSSGTAGTNGSNGTPTSSSAQLLFKLVQRVTALENRTVVRAPFIVVDSQGHALFTVGEKKAASVGGFREPEETDFRGVRIFNDSGQPVVELGSRTGIGSIVEAMDAQNEKTRVGFVVTSTGPSLALEKNSKTGVSATVASDGSGVLQVFSQDEKALAGLQIDRNRGVVAVFNDGGKPVAFLTESDHPGGGNVTLTNPSGDGVVSGGYDGSEGSLCWDHKQHLYCAGMNLPLSMSH